VSEPSTAIAYWCRSTGDNQSLFSGLIFYRRPDWFRKGYDVAHVESVQVGLLFPSAGASRSCSYQSRGGVMRLVDRIPDELDSHEYIFAPLQLQTSIPDLAVKMLHGSHESVPDHLVVRVVTVDWISACLAEGAIVSTDLEPDEHDIGEREDTAKLETSTNKRVYQTNILAAKDRDKFNVIASEMSAYDWETGTIGAFIDIVQDKMDSGVVSPGSSSNHIFS
jgi:hypothetical protein